MILYFTEQKDCKVSVFIKAVTNFKTAEKKDKKEIYQNKKNTTDKKRVLQQ